MIKIQKYFVWCIILLGIFLALFGLKIELWPGFQQNSLWTFSGAQFLNNLQDISWLFLQGPSPQLYQSYQTFLDKTQDKIYIQTYEFSNPYFKSAFLSLLDQGKTIQVIIEDKKFQQYGDPIKQLEAFFSWYQNIQFKSDEQMGTTYVHSKITLNEIGTWIQTANLTTSSYEKNREHFFYTEDRSLRENLQKLFSWDWNWKPLSATELHSNLVVCPQNCREIIEFLLSHAKKSLIIQTQYITDPQIWEILKEQSENIPLKILVADTTDNDELISYFGPWIARKFTQHYNHTKMILIDDTYLLLWSMNLSDNSLDNNREIWIILLDPKHIEDFKKQFEEDRKRKS